MKHLHKKITIGLFCVSLVLMVAGLSRANNADTTENILGDWVFTMSMADNGMGMGPMEFTINSKITKDNEGNYSMTWEQQMTPPPGGGDFEGPGGGGFPTPDVKIENIKFDGDKLTFVQKVSFGDMGGMGGGEITSNFAGTIKGDVIEGKLTSVDNGMGMGSMVFTLNGKRNAAEEPAPLTSAATESADPLVGDWELKMSMADSGMGMGAMEFNINSTVSKDADGNYSMTWEQTMNQPEGGPGGGFGAGGMTTFDVTVENIKLDGNKLTFTRRVNMGGAAGMGGEMVSNFTGTVENGKMEGTVASDFGNMTLTGTRKAAKESVETAEAPKGLEGDWEFVTTFGDMGMELRANVTFKKDADGNYTCTWEGIPMEGMGPRGAGGDMPQPAITITDIKLDEDKVTFVQTVDLSAMQMGEMISNYSGTLNGDKIEGTFTSPMGESKSIGTRKKAANDTAQSDAIVGNWELHLSINNMGMEFNVNSTISKDAEGKYSMTWEQSDDLGMGPIQAKNEDIKLDGENLTFTHIVNVNGTESTYKFTGTVKDSTINGKLTGESGGDMGAPATELTLTGTKK